MAMIRSRNLTSHTDNPELAHEIAGLIVRDYAPDLEALPRVLQRRAEQRSTAHQRYPLASQPPPC
jgi:hypothetical protein